MKTLFYDEKRLFLERTYVVGAHLNCPYEAKLVVVSRRQKVVFIIKI